MTQRNRCRVSAWNRDSETWDGLSHPAELLSDGRCSKFSLRTYGAGAVYRPKFGSSARMRSTHRCMTSLNRISPVASDSSFASIASNEGRGTEGLVAPDDGGGGGGGDRT